VGHGYHGMWGYAKIKEAIVTRSNLYEKGVR